MGRSGAAEDVQVTELSEQEAEDLFDGICQRELHMSGSEFLRRWDVGQYRDVDVDQVDGLTDVVAAISLVR
jgi:hypothetical protein